MRLISIIITLSLVSCHSRTVNNSSIIDFNDNLINQEIYRLESSYFMNHNKVGPYYDLAEHIHNQYKSLKDSLLLNKIDTSKITNYLDFIHYYGQFLGDFNNMKRELTRSDKSSILLQIQNITLFSIKDIQRQLIDNNYPTNLVQVVAYRDDDQFVKLVLSKIDTTESPRFLVGELKQNKNEFKDKFDSVESKPGYARIPIKKIGNKKFIEGIVILQKNNSELDTIRFLSKIN
jgi:hypothetical protein